MQHDEVIWQVIRHKHCSFMSNSCPLANSRYATIRDHDGVFYLYMKTIERAHRPNDLWERVKLPKNYEKALEVIDKHLLYWPKLLVHKIKQRLTKMTQMRIRMRKLALKTREKIMTTPRKEKKREARREEKAEKAAVLEKTIEKELLARLENGIYDGIYNLPFNKFIETLETDELQAEDENEEESAVEYVEGNFELEEEDDIEDLGMKDYHISDEVVDDDGEVNAVEEKRMTRRSKSAYEKSEKDEPGTKLKKKPRIHVEVEHEEGAERLKATF
ncbi:hypothetical protein DITRI_Ditri17bG0060200 [Diplodiscus trichospermus]